MAPPKTPHRNQRQAMLLGVAAVVLWSTVATAFKWSLQEMTPTALLAWASLTSLIVLSGAVSVQRRWSEVFATFRHQPLLYSLLGALNPCLYYLVLLRAYNLLPAQQAQSLNYTWALTLALLAVPLLQQKLTLRDAAALLIGYCGAVVIATGGNPFALQVVSVTGVTLALGSTILWSLFWILNTRATAPPAVGLLLCFAVGTPLVWLALAFEGDPMIPSPRGFAGAVYVGVFEMGLTFMLWLAAMQRAEQVSRVANLIFLSPFLSLLLIHNILGETILPSTWIGLVLIVIGVAIQQRPVAQPDA